MAEGVPEDLQRWTSRRRTALVLSILKGETSVAEAARKHGLKVSEVEDWKERFLLGAENALRSRPRDDEALKDEQIKRLKQKVGELVPGPGHPEDGGASPPHDPDDVRALAHHLVQLDSGRVVSEHDIRSGHAADSR